MFELYGKYNSCKVFTDNVNSETISQIMMLLNNKKFSNSSIRIMPDTHVGKGCVVGTSITLNDNICVPELIGPDIGCGMLAIQLEESDTNLEDFDKIIRTIPAGTSVNEKQHEFVQLKNLNSSYNRSLTGKSLGTLGGGNHFIELNRDNNGYLWLVIHTGSRHLGIDVYNFYTKNESKPEDYLHDMSIVQEYAAQNRWIIADTILRKTKLHLLDSIDTVHNYIDTDTKILRKGAISAKKGEKVIIPMNMRDGSLICIGKGNKDWNQSAPHGAGRCMSRRDAKEKITIESYKKSMEDVYSSSVKESTISEAPMAYKPMDEIITNIRDTVEICDIIKPIYNFKAS